MRIQKILNESKNIGDIYHFTDSLKTVCDIINSGELVSSNREEDFNTKSKMYAFSFTRDRNLSGYKSFKYGIIFNGNKLSNKYSIVPFRFDTESLLIKSVRYICKCGDNYFLSVFQYSSDDKNITENVLNKVKNNNINSGVIIAEEIYEVLKRGFLKLIEEYNKKDRLINIFEKEMDIIDKYRSNNDEEIDFFSKLEYSSYSPSELEKKYNTLSKKLKKEKNRKPIIYRKFDNGNEVFIFNSKDQENVVTGSISLESLYKNYGGGNKDDLKKYLREKTFDDKEERIWFNVGTKNSNFSVYKNNTKKHKNSKFEIHLSIKPVKEYIVGFILPKKEYDEVISGNIETKYLKELVKMFPKSEYKYLIR